MPRELLGHYLNDHLAGSTALLELLDRFAEANEDWKHEVTGLKTEIETDREELSAIMNRLGVSESPVRNAAGWLAEKLMTLKLGLDDSGTGPLRRLETFEAAVLGIEGKQALWRVLETIAGSIEEIRPVDFRRLISRAKEQRERAEQLRLRSAAAALI